MLPKTMCFHKRVSRQCPTGQDFLWMKQTERFNVTSKKSGTKTTKTPVLRQPRHFGLLAAQRLRRMPQSAWSGTRRCYDERASGRISPSNVGGRARRKGNAPVAKSLRSRQGGGGHAVADSLTWHASAEFSEFPQGAPTRSPCG